MLQQSQLIVKPDPSEVPAGLAIQQPPHQSPPQLQAYHLATVAPRGEQVQVALSNASTWRKFCRQNTEMIVTKAGRRMFPSLSLEIRGLDPARRYELYVTLLLADQHTLKYQRGVWIPNGPSEAYPPPGCTAGLVYVHPDSPSTGRHWTKQEVTFMKLKLTNKLDGFNDPSRNGAMIFAYSMHKYLPVVHISEVPQSPGLKHEAAAEGRFYTSVVFPGTEFITVTAYQNPELTDLKIQFNPYAKGIRNQTDRSSTILIDTFRPIAQSRQQQQQPEPQQQQHLMSQNQQLASQQQQQQTGFEFGSYPSQTASAYGHWQPATAPSRRHQPYSFAPASSTQLELGSTASSRYSSSPATGQTTKAEASASTSSSSTAAAAAAAASAFYPAGQYFYQPYQHHHSMYYQPHHGDFYAHQLQLQQQQQQGSDQLSEYQQPLTPPLQHPAPAVYATPQGCSLLAASSSTTHVTDSSPSGVSFHSPDL